MSVMINEMVYKEGIEAVQCVMMGKIIRNPSTTINRQKVSSTSNGIQRNNLNSRLPPLIAFKLYSPHSSIRITFVIMHEPIDLPYYFPSL